MICISPLTVICYSAAKIEEEQGLNYKGQALT